MGTDLKIVRMFNKDENFYSVMGPFLSRREIVAELGNPIWDDPEKEWFIAYQGSQMVGFAALRKKGRQTLLVSSYVLPAYRKSGVYTALLKARMEAFQGPLKAIATPSSVPALLKAGMKESGKRGKFTVMDRE
jgi:GNAT superfamily N-acetyltransferase